MGKTKDKLYKIIFEADTKAGKAFDVLLINAIIISIITVVLDSVPGINDAVNKIFLISEWVFTILFTLEYILRIIIIRKPFKYIFSFYGLVDLLAILPTYLGMIISGGSSLLVIRAIRILRIFRVFKLSRYTYAGRIISRSLRASQAKIGVFLVAVFTIILIIGTLMYLIEGPENGYSSIPIGVYWTIVTITTVGYGDIAPVTAIGQIIASLTMLTGFALIAVPTGIVSAELSHQQRILSGTPKSRKCHHCLAEGHDEDAVYCNKCGGRLN